jgi:periplasmic divalent cation tolerance protein
MAGEILVLVTCSKDESERLATTLVEEHLVACVNIVDALRSVYLWNGDLCKEAEHLLVIKSTQSNWDALQERVKALHSYDVPEILYIPIGGGNKPYMDWLNTAVNARL